jgi:hypothetical protein
MEASVTHRLLNVSAAAIAIAGVIVPPSVRAQQPEIAIAVAFTEGPAVDRDGNVYFTEMVAQRIMKLSAKGVLTTFRENSNGANGLLIDPPNLPGWQHFPIRDRVQQACGRPVSYANDAAAAAYGEFWVGSGRTMHSMVLFTLGTGVGGGIIIGDLLVQGENSFGSELGHLIIDYNDTAAMCPCGLRGHLEAYASESAIIERMRLQLTGASPDTTAAWLAAQGRLPWRLMGFLDEAHQRGALRQVGSYYQFRHIELQRELARDSFHLSTSRGGLA